MSGVGRTGGADGRDGVARRLVSDRWSVRLWILALLAYCLGDGATTFLITSHTPTASEANPLVRFGVAWFGPWGLVGLKQLVVCAVLLLSRYAAGGPDDGLDPIPPALLALVGLATTASNAALLLG